MRSLSDEVARLSGLGSGGNLRHHLRRGLEALLAAHPVGGSRDLFGGSYEGRLGANIGTSPTFSWKANLKNLDMAAVTAAAAKVKEYAGQMGTWFPPGTGPEAGETKAKAIVWTERADFDAKLADLHVWQVGPQAWSVALSIVADRPREVADYRERLHALRSLRHTTIEVHRCTGAAAH